MKVAVMTPDHSTVAKYEDSNNNT